jgi:plasmid stabilization system protein ParE
MDASFHPEADDDFTRALRHYAAIQPALGERFFRHIEGLVADITANPTLFRIFRPPQVRRHFQRPFPYAVVYIVMADRIWILAVMHFKQPPSYWHHRL